MLKVVLQMYSKMPTKPKICIFFRFGLPTIGKVCVECCLHECFIHINPFCILETPKQVLLQNSEDPDEMSHNVASHQGLHRLLILKIMIYSDEKM